MNKAALQNREKCHCCQKNISWDSGREIVFDDAAELMKGSHFGNSDSLTFVYHERNTFDPVIISLVLLLICHDPLLFYCSLFNWTNSQWLTLTVCSIEQWCANEYEKHLSSSSTKSTWDLFFTSPVCYTCLIACFGLITRLSFDSATSIVK